METQQLEKELDKTKAKVFIGTNAAFLGSLLCSLEFKWSDDISTAATDGKTVWWNPEFFTGLSKDQRVTVLLHEIWHVARLHMHRRGSRNPHWWNVACDYVINNEMQQAGYIFDGIGLLDPKYKGMAEEDIYDLLAQQPEPEQKSPYSDLVEPSKEDLQAGLNNVVKAVHAAKEAKQVGSVPGSTLTAIEAYLAPVVPWEILLDRFMQELLEEDYSWSKPNRRYQDIYLPHRYEDEGKLEKLNYYLDVSGSISDQEILRFNSEIKFIKNRYNPVELNLIQFDTIIQKETTIKHDNAFDGLEVIRGGGTSLVPVREHILNSKPTAAIIFTDLYCPEMEKLPNEIPVIWVIVNHKKAKPAFGQCVHVNTNNP